MILVALGWGNVGFEAEADADAEANGEGFALSRLLDDRELSLAAEGLRDRLVEDEAVSCGLCPDDEATADEDRARPDPLRAKTSASDCKSKRLKTAPGKPRTLASHSALPKRKRQQRKNNIYPQRSVRQALRFNPLAASLAPKLRRAATETHHVVYTPLALPRCTA